MVDRQVLDEIKNKLDIVDYLEKKGVSLSQRGTNFIGLCPFHSERTPSFNVRPALGVYRCFGCGVSGDIFSLIQHEETIGFPAAVELAAELAGVELPEFQDEEYKQLKRQYQILETAADYFRQQFLALPDSHPAKQNLESRRLLQEGIQDDSVGWAPDAQTLLSYLYEQRFSAKELIGVGLARQTEDGKTQAVFRNRLMWTLHDVSGRPIAFSGRKVLESDTLSPKYVNTPQTRLYDKSKTLMGLARAKKTITDTGIVYVVEGQTDVMALRAVGIENVVASCGTAFGEGHIDTVLRLARQVRKEANLQFIFCFDGDEAGQKAAQGTFEKGVEIQQYAKVVVMEVDGVMYDPCDLRLHKGDEALKTALKDAIPLVEFILTLLKNNYDLGSHESRSVFIQESLKRLVNIKDPILYNSYLRTLSSWTGIAYSELTSLSRTPAPRTSTPASPTVQGKPASADLDTKMFAAYVQYPTVVQELFQQNRVTAQMFSDPAEARRVFAGEADVAELGFYDLKFSEIRLRENIQDMITTFLRVKYLEEQSLVNAKLGTKKQDLTPEEYLSATLEIQAELKAIYSQ